MDLSKFFERKWVVLLAGFVMGIVFHKYIWKTLDKEEEGFRLFGKKKSSSKSVPPKKVTFSPEFIRPFAEPVVPVVPVRKNKDVRRR